MTGHPPPDDGTEPPWWSVRKEPSPDPDPGTADPLPPGVHVHITQQPPPTPVDPATAGRRARARRWLAIHGAAASIGWVFGLYDAISLGLHTTRRGGVPMGLALAGITYVLADFILTRYGRLVPERLRPAAAWVLRIPFATALLATALYAPNALI